MPKTRKRTANLFEVDAARAVNSEMSRRSRDRSQPLPRNLLNVDLQATEPRQIRKVLTQDVKDARARIIESASSPSVGKKLFWADTGLRRDRHVACGSARGNKALRFLTAGSRDLESNELPKCYFDPKGSRVRSGRGMGLPIIRGPA